MAKSQDPHGQNEDNQLSHKNPSISKLSMQYLGDIIQGKHQQMERQLDMDLKETEIH